jgi:c-di-GMP-binding flagellar brake protein YcgR
MIESRRYERVSFFCKLELASTSHGEHWPARALDLSLGGVGVVTDAYFEIGESVNVRFFLKDSRQEEATDEVMGRVARFAADQDANEIGIQFLEPLTDAAHPRLVRKLMSL